MSEKSYSIGSAFEVMSVVTGAREVTPCKKEIQHDRYDKCAF